MFQQVVQTFDLRHLIGGSAQATVFQGMLCLLLYNVTLVIRDYVAAGVGAQPEAVSLELLFDAVVRDLTGWMEVLGPAATPALLAASEHKVIPLQQAAGQPPPHETPKDG